jgi:hypothetical protein
MASILSAKLSIKVTSGTVTPTVNFKLGFTQGELNLMRSFPNLYRLRCELWGSDSGLNGADDKVFIYPDVRLYPDATISALEEGSFSAVLNKGAQLNEDNSFFDDKDEIYAKMILTNTFAGTSAIRNSNKVTGLF